MVLQAGLAALLTRLGAGNDIAIGSPIAGRTDEALEGLVGFFVNTLVLRTDTSGDPSFGELLGRVRATDLAAYGHQDLPFERLVEVLNPARSLSRHPLFQVMLAFQEEVAEPALTGLVVTGGASRGRRGEVRRIGEPEERLGSDGAALGLDGVLEYATDLFDAASAAALVERLVRLLTAAVADPARPIGRLDILAIEERRQILEGWNDTARAVEATTLPACLRRRWRATRRRLRWCARASAAELRGAGRRANQLAHLRRLGVGAESVVGLCLERSAEMVIGLLGIVTAGAAYLPLDPDYPSERLAIMLGDAGAGAGDAIGSGGPVRPEAPSCCAWTPRPISTASPPPRPPHSTSITSAYVIYTSGSTGRPKGAMVTHRGMLNHLNAKVADLLP